MKYQYACYFAFVLFIFVAALKEVSCETSTSSVSPASSSATTTATEGNTTTVSPDTTVILPTTTRVKLSLSSNLSPFWVVTLLSNVPTTEDTTDSTWRNNIEDKLVLLVKEAVASRRRKRAAKIGSLQVQLVSSNRVSGTNNVRLVYYAVQDNQPVSSPNLVTKLKTVDTRAPIVLGYTVQSTAATFESVDSSDDRLWVIGAVVGALGGIVLVTWIVLFVHFKCLRPLDPNPPMEVIADEFYTDSLRPIAHMRANPKLAYSQSDISEIAQEVAKQLDQHVNQLVVGRFQSEQQLQHHQQQQVEHHESTNHVSSPLRVKAESEGPIRRKPPRSPSTLEDGDEQELPQEMRVGRSESQITHNEQYSGQHDMAKYGPARSIDRHQRRHEELERKRNKERLRKKQRRERSTSENERRGVDDKMDNNSTSNLLPSDASFSPRSVSSNGTMDEPIQLRRLPRNHASVSSPVSRHPPNVRHSAEPRHKSHPVQQHPPARPRRKRDNLSVVNPMSPQAEPLVEPSQILPLSNHNSHQSGDSGSSPSSVVEVNNSLLSHQTKAAAVVSPYYPGDEAARIEAKIRPFIETRDARHYNLNDIDPTELERHRQRRSEEASVRPKVISVRPTSLLQQGSPSTEQEITKNGKPTPREIIESLKMELASMEPNSEV